MQRRRCTGFPRRGHLIPITSKAPISRSRGYHGDAAKDSPAAISDQYVPSFGWSVEPYYRIGIAKNLEGFHWYTTQYYDVYQMSFKE